MLNWKWDISLAVLAAAMWSADPAVGQTTTPVSGYTSGAPQAIAADYYAGADAQQPVQPVSLSSSCGCEPGCAAPQACDVCDGCNGSGCDSCCSLGERLECGLPCREHCEPWTLFGEHCSGLTMGGWVSAGIYSNQYGNDGIYGNGPIGMRQLANEFSLNQAWFFAEKLADGECGLDYGYRVDYIFGTDGPDTQAFGQASGYDTDWDTSSRYGSALPQLYGQVAYGDLSVKIGHFYTIIGYEVVQATGNFFTSHSYTMYYGEPFTHTGALGEYAYSDNVTLYGGWTQGWDTAFDDGGDPGASTFLGGVGLQLTEDVKATYAANAGQFNGFNGGGDIYMQSVVVTANLTQKWSYVFQTDYGVQSDIQPGDKSWYGINQYLFYTINDCWSAGARFEWFDDHSGARVLDGAGNPYGPGEYYAITAGVNWKPTANLTFRPEVRYDWFDGKAGSTDPFDNGADDKQFAGGFDMIYTY